jgi:hypothetical protein
MKKYFLIFIIVLLSGCKSQSDIKLETAAKVYVENMLIEDKYTDRPDTALILCDKVYAKYKMSKDEYKKVFDGLSIDKDKWDVFFTLSEKYLDSLKSKKSLN